MENGYYLQICYNNKLSKIFVTDNVYLLRNKLIDLIKFLSVVKLDYMEVLRFNENRIIQYISNFELKLLLLNYGG